jgi:Clp amino terminal domain, pathogenicity island component
MGRAEGVAAGMGSRQPSPEHWLFAILWDADGGTVPLVLRRLGGSPKDIVRRLREAGADVPAIDPPEPREVRPVEKVTFPASHLDVVRAEFPNLLPPGTQWGWNHDREGTGFVVASAYIDVRAYLDVALVEARRAFERSGVCDERFRDQVRHPRPDEVPPWRTA